MRYSPTLALVALVGVQVSRYSQRNYLILKVRMSPLFFEPCHDILSHVDSTAESARRAYAQLKIDANRRGCKVLQSSRHKIEGTHRGGKRGEKSLLCDPDLSYDYYYGGTILLRGAIVNRTYDIDKNLHIKPFLLTIFGPVNFGPP